MDPGFPRIIGESWNGIPDDIDSAFSLNDIGKAFPFLPFSLVLLIMGIKNMYKHDAFSADKHFFSSVFTGILLYSDANS